jgi:hypothetical protein
MSSIFPYRNKKRRHRELLPPFGRETALWVKTIDEDRRERHYHHQPLRQIHLSRTEICLKKRSHPCPAVPRNQRRLRFPAC